MEIEDIHNKSMDITELICQLQQEKLLVDTERSNLEILNEELVEHINKLIKATWINAQQRVNLNNLVARPDYTPEQCCKRSVALANCTFIQAKELYDYQTVSNISQFISLLRKRTEQLAQWIVIGERLSKDTQLFCQILQTIIAGLYGSLLLPEDVNMLLNLLRYLARFQLVTTDNPRRKLGQGSCAFSKMYLLFHESLPSAKLFLIAALQYPIIQLIANTNECLDIDPDKTIQRLSILDRFEKFGPHGTPEYDVRVSEFRKYVLDKLTTFAHSFICSIQENIYCFPSTLASLVKHIIQMISQSFGEHSKEVSEISTDLIFTLYICPAIVNPEPYGVCDAPISPAARHNLIQISQLLQQLALVRTATTNGRSNGDEPHSCNDANSCPSMGADDCLGSGKVTLTMSPMHMLLQQRCDGDAIIDIMDLLLAKGDESEDLSNGDSQLSNVPGVHREFIVATEYELNHLVSFLVKAHNTTLEDLGGMNETASSASDMQQQQQPNAAASGEENGSRGTNISDSDNDQLFALLTKLPSTAEGGNNGSGGSNGSGSPRHSTNILLQQNGSAVLASENTTAATTQSNGGSANKGGGGKRQILMNKVTGGKASHHHQHSHQHQHHLRTSSSSDSTSDEPIQPLTVLLIPLHTERQLIGLLPENKVLLMATSNKNNSDGVSQVTPATVDLFSVLSESVVTLNNDSSDGTMVIDVERMVPCTGQEKRTRFGATGDEGSIGNTSDNLEAISEAASNHSVASSIELEDHDDDDDDIVDGQNDGDNLSDMVSANVSGRGSPNISGRDTPSSQVTENEDRGGGGGGGIEVGVIAGEVRPVYNVNSPQHVMNVKHSILRHSDIDDKFCKFEIKQQLIPATADETVSIISDTWSTDVLASDSETVDVTADMGCVLRHFSPIVEQPTALQASTAAVLLDVSETQSESAWSTDVLVASDTERLTEMDNDDLASVAPSDDTASVAPSEPDDAPLHHQLLNDRKLSTTSTTNYSTISGYDYAQQLDHVSSGQDASLSSHRNEIIIMSRRDSAPAPSFPQPKVLEDDNADGARSTHMKSYAPMAAFDYSPDIGPSAKDDKVENTLQPIIDDAADNTNSNIMRQSSRSCTDMTSCSSSSSGSRREAILIEVGSTTELNLNATSAATSSKSHIYQKHTHTAVSTTTHYTNRTGHRLPSLPLIPIATDLPITVSVTEANICPISGGDKVTCATNSNAPAYSLVKNISTQKYEATADSQLSNTSLNSSSSGSSNGRSEHQNKGILFTGNSINHGRRKQKWNENLNAHSTLMENAPADHSLKSTNGSSIISNAGNSGKKILANGSVVGVNGNYNRGNGKLTAATGAIPKSISFDMSAEKGDKDHGYDDQKSRRSGSSGGIFGKLRLNLRSRRGKTSGVVRDEFLGSSGDRGRTFTEHISTATQNSSDVSEDILAKYRRNTSHTKKNGSILTNDTSKPRKILELDDNDNQLILIESDPNSIHCAFEDAKKKLRIILSNSKSHNFLKDGRKHTKKDLETFLQLEMAKAMHFKQWSIVARISETLRCIKLLDNVHFYKLCDILQSDISNRKVYVQYLLHSRQILLCSHSFLEELTEQVDRESELCSSFLVSICVRLYLDRHNQMVQEFTSEFKRLTLVDEKHYLLSTFLMSLYAQMRKDSFWQDATNNQIEQTQIAIERSVMAEVYLHALHPNGDMDRERDRMLIKHLAKLGRSLTPDHKDLQIGLAFRREAPWLPAQEALRSIAAYRAARDKVRCVSRCAGAIMSLLSLGQNRGSTAADDFVPVLVYVIIKANPQDLLSTIQYVKSFYGTQLRGEEEYWWTQFCSAVEFTKTMEYSD